MNYTKEEILALSDKTEEEQVKWLIEHEIMDKLVDNAEPPMSIESLADCAFRLRDELLKEYETPKGWVWSDCYRPIAHIIAPNNTCTHCGHDDRYFDWDAEAKPIHWIQAALLAKIERGE